jgi:ElaB/YqjD/DUF883 family membrane-anchored ribosome-binding protein
MPTLSDNDSLTEQPTKRRCNRQTPSHFTSTWHFTSLYAKGMNMENTAPGNFAKTSQALADKAADRVQTGIHGAKESVKDAGEALSSKVSSARETAAPLIGNVGGKAQSTAQQSFDALNDMADQAREMLSSATDSVVSYTKKRPLQALVIAAASGALIYAALKAFRAYRE